MFVMKQDAYLYTALLIMFLLYQSVVDAVLAVKPAEGPIDLHMVEIMDMVHKTESDTK